MSQRLKHIDAIRGIACLLVVFIHFCEHSTLIGNVFFRYCGPGQIGVVVFFMISGFVIPYSFTKEKGQPLLFIVSRFFRLYPAFWLSVLLATISFYIIDGNSFDVATIFANLTMIPGVFGKVNLYSIYWTLLVEMAFYVVCVFLFMSGWLGDVKKIFQTSVFLLLLSVCCAVVRYVYGKGMPVGMLFAVSLMLFSFILRQWLHSGNHDAKKYTVIWGAFFVLLLPVICFMTYDLGDNQPSYVSYVVNYFSGIAIFCLFAFKWKIKSSAITGLGVVSYSVYLTHPFFVDVFYHFYGVARDFNVVAFVGVCCSVITFAIAVYFFVEKPGIKLGRKVRGYISSV